jgi:hypothetical protein
MPEKDQLIKTDGNSITILRKKYNVLAFTSFSEDILETIKYQLGGYMESKKYGSLHKHVMALKYGEHVIREEYDNNFVIDHINNNGFNCMYTNLDIVSRNLNTAGGLTYDQERKNI